MPRTRSVCGAAVRRRGGRVSARPYPGRGVSGGAENRPRKISVFHRFKTKFLILAFGDVVSGEAVAYPRHVGYCENLLISAL